MVSWAFIFKAPETDPAIDRLVIERGGLRTTIVAVPGPAEAIRVAVELVDGGVQFIELCGAFFRDRATSVSHREAPAR